MLTNELYAIITENQLLMVMNKNARKQNAIKEIAKHFGLTLFEIAAFGDDYNDIEMLRECGFGVAVANAIDEVKAAANYVCGDCDNDGVAKWLEENLL
jgi:hydroxymethylpyrimidine pyrophosphatase-like HAD family hydrolase